MWTEHGNNETVMDQVNDRRTAIKITVEFVWIFAKAQFVYTGRENKR